MQCDSSVVWYLPHRFPINPKKPDCLKRVYDASAKFVGQSLNDKIYTAPDLLSSLFGVFLRFCEGRIVMAADVKEMYHMLHLPDADENGADLPLGVRVVYKHFYMDDSLPSTNSREEAIVMRELTTELLCHGGFCLHKWLMNDLEVLATTPKQDRSPQFLELEVKISCQQLWQQSQNWPTSSGDISQRSTFLA